MRWRMIRVIAAREWRTALTSRWFWSYTVALSLLGSLLLWMAWATMPPDLPADTAGGRVLVATINLLALVVPLMGLSAGTQSLAAERDRRSLGYLLAQPVSRTEVLLGKLTGNIVALAAAIGGATLLHLIVAWALGMPVPVGALLVTALLAWFLGLASLALGTAIGAGSGGMASAQGTMIMAWLVLVLLGDMGLMGLIMFQELPVKVMLMLTFLNPVHQFRVAAVALMRPTLEVLGPVGIYAQERLGTMLAPALVTSLVAWTAGAVLVALERFKRSRSAS